MRTTHVSCDPRNRESALVRESTIAAIKSAVAYFFGMPIEELHHNSTTRAVTVPRQIAMYLVKQMTDASLPEIGRWFGGKHHSTVTHAIAKIEGRRHMDVGLDFTICKLVTSIRDQSPPTPIAHSDSVAHEPHDWFAATRTQVPFGAITHHPISNRLGNEEMLINLPLISVLKARRDRRP